MWELLGLGIFAWTEQPIVVFVAFGITRNAAARRARSCSYSAFVTVWQTVGTAPRSAGAGGRSRRRERPPSTEVDRDDAAARAAPQLPLLALVSRRCRCGQLAGRSLTGWRCRRGVRRLRDR